MASYTATRAKHATLSGTTADTVTIGTAGSLTQLAICEVFNRDASVGLYFTLSRGATAPTTATSAADNSFYVGPSSSLAVSLPNATPIFAVSVVGNGNAYSVHGFLA